MEPGDIVIDGGNTYYRDDIDRAKAAAAEAAALRGRRHVGRGVRAGAGFLPDDRRRGRAGGAAGPDLQDIAPGAGTAEPTPGRTRTGGTAPDGYLHCGPAGAGHFVKMVHNGIEYGMMAAIAEGLSIIKHANVGQDRGAAEVDAETTPLRDPQYYQYDIDVAEVAEVWRRGSVDQFLADGPDRGRAGPVARAGQLRRARVSDSGEGRWTVMASIDEGVPAPVITAVAGRAVRVPRPRRVQRQGAVRDAQRVRRSRGAEGVMRDRRGNTLTCALTAEAPCGG